MVDSTPSLQNHAPSWDNSQIRPETANLSHQMEASARLASEFLSARENQGQNATPADTTGGAARAAAVITGGLKDGFVDSAKHSLNLNTAQTVAESLGIGYGLGALAKAGPIGEKLAIVGGAAMGAKWLYDEIEKGRPQATINAAIDAYNHKENVAHDRSVVAANGGTLAFESTLALGAGGIGMKKGLELKNNWHTDALAAGKSSFNSAVDFLGHDGRVNGLHVLGDGKMGSAFAGKDKIATGNQATGGADFLGHAKDIISGKSKGSGTLADIQEQFTRSQMQSNDAHLLDMRAKLVDLDGAHTAVRNEETALTPKLNKATREKSEAENLTGLEQAVHARQQGLTDAQGVSRELPRRKGELDKLFEEKQAAFKKQTPENGAPMDPATQQGLREDFQSKHRAHLAAKEVYDDLKTQGGADAIARHREGLTEAQNTLQTARTEQPAKLAAAHSQIEELNAQMTALRTRRTEIEAQIKPLVDGYQTRLSGLIKDPGGLIQAQFEPPAAKPQPKAAAKLAETPIIEVAKPAPAPEIKAEIKPEVKPEVAPIAPAAPVAVAHVEVAPMHVEKPVVADKPVSDAKPVVAEATLDRTTEKATEPATLVDKMNPAAQANREAALKAIRGNELFREQEYCNKVLSEIQAGTYRPTNRASIVEVKADMQRRLEEANEKLKADPSVKYTRALKTVLQYGKTVSRQLAETTDRVERFSLTDQALDDIEGMMNRLPTAYKGVPGSVPDLSESGHYRTGSPEARFDEVVKHLSAKVEQLDNSRMRHVADMTERQPVLREVMRQLDGDKLPADGSIILIGKDGKYLGPRGGKSPFFIEVSRLHEHGVGADGGGFNRFESIANDIGGAVVLRPIYDAAGKPVEIPGRTTNGKPVVKKTVAYTIGEVPEGIKPALNFAQILCNFAPPRS